MSALEPLTDYILTPLVRYTLTTKAKGSILSIRLVITYTFSHVCLRDQSTHP